MTDKCVTSRPYSVEDFFIRMCLATLIYYVLWTLISFLYCIMSSNDNSS